MSAFERESLIGVDGSGKIDPFVESTDESYSHPSAGGGGFASGAPHFGKPISSSTNNDYSTNTNTTGSSNTDDYSTNTSSSYTGNDQSSYGQGGSSSEGRTFGSGRGADHHERYDQGTAEVIPSYEGGDSYSGNQQQSYGGKSNYDNSDPAYAVGGIGAGAGAGEALASRDLSSTSGGYGSRGGIHDTAATEPTTDTTTTGGDVDGGYIGGYGGDGGKYVGEVPETAHASSGGYDRSASSGAYDNSSSGGYDNSSSGGNQSGGFSSDQVRDNATGNPQADQAINTVKSKVDDRTGEDGFTDLTGGNEPGGGLTGRVKLDKNPVVETTADRSNRDSKGRELDSYGKPYDL